MSGPRRCGKRWLDGDCPRGVLAIMDHGSNELERYDVIYATVESHGGYGDWLTGVAVSEHGSCSHFELKLHEAAAYRYRKKHRYTTWSSLPDAVKNVVRRDLDVTPPPPYKDPRAKLPRGWEMATWDENTGFYRKPDGSMYKGGYALEPATGPDKRMTA